MLTTSALIGLVLGLASCSNDPLPKAPPPAPASALYLNGHIYTGVPDRPWAEAMVTVGGAIHFVGSNEDAQRALTKPEQTHDLDGHFVMAGIVDAHTHPGMVAVLPEEEGTSTTPMPAKPKQATMEWLRNYDNDHPFTLMVNEGVWDVAEFLPSGPHKQQLDEIFPLTPVILYDNSGHSMWVNSATLTLLGIDKHTSDISKNISEFVRDEHGEPTGWIKEFALMPSLQGLLLPAEKEIRNNLLQQLNFLASKGVTTIWDAGNFDMDDPVYAQVATLDKAGLLPLRYEGSYHIWNPAQIDTAVYELLQLREKYTTNKLKFNTIKIHFDGVAEILTAGMLEPYETDAQNSGGILFTKERLKALMLELDQADINLHMHVVGDRATRTALDAWQLAIESKGKPLTIELSLSHLETVHPDDIKRFKDLGVHANFTPHWFGGLFGEAGKINLGNERASRSQVVGHFIDSGANVTLSSDVVSGDEAYRANPFIGIEMSITRQEFGSAIDAKTFSPANAAISIEEALQAYTINGARQLGYEERIGTLQAGKLADFIVLNTNPLETSPKAIHKISPTATVVEGQLVFGSHYSSK
ncbi:MAG: amidohydrolase [Oceanicoccus sp.]